MRAQRYRRIRTTVDPPLPVPELVRDEFNAYRHSTLQTYLYELIFKQVPGSKSNGFGPGEALVGAKSDLISQVPSYLRTTHS